MPDSSTLWMAAGLLWILDASINVSMEPFRAFVADKLNVDQRTAGFVMQSSSSASVRRWRMRCPGCFANSGNRYNLERHPSDSSVFFQDRRDCLSARSAVDGVYNQRVPARKHGRV